MEQNLMPKNADFHCVYCDFHCCKKSNWNIHLNTTKHTLRVNGNNMENAEIDKNAENMCDCGKKYATKSGLWKHKPKCTVKNNMKNTLVKEETNDKDDLILMLIKQNSALIKETSDFKNLMVEQQNMMMKVIENGKRG